METLINWSWDGMPSPLLALAVLTTPVCMSPITRPHISHHSENLYHLCLTSTITIAVSDVPGSGTRVHTHAHGGSKAYNDLPNSILLNELKPLGKHRPPPL
ncbi:hypothetical protein Tco_0492598 [Tanacetum coccineum]